MPPERARKSWWDWYFFDWYSGQSLGVLRAYFGVGLIFYLCTQFPQLLILDVFGAEFVYTLPIWYFDLLGIDRNIPWLIFLVFPAMLVAAGLLAAGKWTKPAIVAVILCIFYLKGVRDSFSGDVHHREVPIVAILVLFLFSKCDRVFAVDARRRRPEAVENWEGSWPIRAMQTYIAMFYFWALVAKLRVSGLHWFEGGGRVQDVLIERALRDGFDASGHVVNLEWAYALAQRPDLIFAFGMLVFVFETTIPAILFIRSWRVRLALLVGAFSFHLANFVLLNVQFYFYPFVFLIFFDLVPVHEWLRRRVRGRARGGAPPTVDPEGSPT